MSDRYTLDIKPLRGNTSACFTIWDNETGKVHQKETVKFPTPEDIKREKLVWDNLVSSLNNTK